MLAPCSRLFERLTAGLLAVSTLLLLPMGSAQAASAVAVFDVSITLSKPETGTCVPGVTGTTPALICDTGLAAQVLNPSLLAARPRPDGGYRFISYVAGLNGSVDIYTGAGTSTAFRLVHWADHEYIEMTVGW